MTHLTKCGVLSLFAFTSIARASTMVPFVIPADIHPGSQIAVSGQVLTEQDRLTAGEHFVNQTGQRVRLWGVNLTFEANFPTHQDAERIAKRMAAFGVNTVRCHHMDTMPWPRGIWDASGKELHPEALDRLDYFINQLSMQGIYTNINLHVGKKHSAAAGLPDPATEMDKIVTLFTPELIEAQKDYARKLLTHQNPYRSNRTYADDFAVAIVEITNENSLFMWGAENTLRTLPPFYADILAKRYNLWLKEKYKTQAGLLKAWLSDGQPLGANLLKNPTLTDTQAGLSPWSLELHAQTKAAATIKEYRGRPGLLINPVADDGTDWHLQLNQGQIKLRHSQVYTLEFDAAGPDRPLHISVMQGHEPWKSVGLSHSITLSPEWKICRVSFTSTDDEANARLSFYFGDDKKPFYLSNVKLRPGVQYTLDKDESLDTATVRLFGETESEQRKVDRMLFLAETEKAYFDAMKAFIKNDLGCKAMVTGTIVFGPLGLYAQSDMDFVDGHAYWQHPRFPNRSWDMADWLVEQKAMSDFREQSTLYRLSVERLEGKPFTVTEYNHPAPLDSQAECVPMIASFAAANDWDGVWIYTYSHSQDWDRQHLNSFFDVDTNPAKWGFMPAGSYLFRTEQMQPSRTLTAGILPFSSPDQMNIEQLASLHLKVDHNMPAAIKNGLKQATARQGGRFSLKAELEWTNVNSKGLYVARNDTCVVATGRTERFGEVQGGCSIGIKEPGFAAVTVVALDGKPLAESGRILVTACGRCENTGMEFSKDRVTVGTKWGKAPVLLEPVEGAIRFAGPQTKRVCKALKPDGSVGQTTACTDNTVMLKAEHGTMWYLVETQD